MNPAQFMALMTMLFFGVLVGGFFVSEGWRKTGWTVLAVFCGPAIVRLWIFAVMG